MTANSFNQRRKQLTGCADPSGKRRTVQIDAFAGIDLRLPVERKMVGILRDQHMREQTWTCESTIDGPRWRGRLHDAVAGIATQLRTHVADDLEAGPHVLQHLGHVFAQLAQSAPAVGTSLVAWYVRVDLTRKMLGQRAAEGLGWSRTFCRSGGLQLLDGAGNLQVFELELKLLDLADHLLALRAEEHPL